MVELLEEGTIVPDMAPCDAYQTDPIFQKCKDANGMGDGLAK